ncbi:carbohydrate porin [Roseomonas eburnea]|uniref:Carbohydrate porin n=1 Tax=Neoroseomonas eburnea TaxID=1346889 RepID=A0A9X9XJX5_9PROT|nr:carbohydrate porin [Neoroseomonas eburnea]MBR0684011.1 carbohydrate porin [Neoroseomonas eburnea]
MRLDHSAAAALLAALLLSPGIAGAEEPPDCAEGFALTPGLCLSTEVTVDAIANLRGGIRRGVAGIGQVWSELDADLGTLAGLDGWSARVSVIGVLGRQPSATLTGGLAPASNIEAVSTVRLFELWAERSFGAWGSIRFGQLAADGEFAVADPASTLVNGTFGWPVALATGRGGGGPAYPLAAPGIRLALGDPQDGTGLRLGLFSGNPGGRYGDGTDPQQHNRYGITFSTAGGALVLAEAVTGAAPPEPGGHRPWVLKLGGWFHNGGFDSPRYDENGLSLADPASNGVPRRYDNSYGAFGVAEAILWREDDTQIAVFVRGFAQPADRNTVALQLDAGLALRGPFGRAEDTATLGVSWARIGSAARGYDRDLAVFGDPVPVRSHETVIEVNYDAAVVPERLFLRPFVQGLFNPAGGAPDERRGATRSMPDSLLVGLRAVTRF